MMNAVSSDTTFDAEIWGAGDATEYDSFEDLIEAVTACAIDNGWPMPSKESIEEWWES